jgi:hypothetical protein
MGLSVPKYKALPNSAFEHNNQAFYPKYKKEIIQGETEASVDWSSEYTDQEDW